MSGCCGGGGKRGDKKPHISGKIDKFLVIVISATLLIFIAGLIWATKSGNTSSASVSQTQTASLSLSETSYDWGDIPINEGNVEKTFSVTNTGSSDLELANFVTSCMCTTARVITADGESQEFGMHTKSNWKGTISPGETAQVIVIFDPAFHGPQGVGSITRIVKFNTNASGFRLVELSLTGIVI